MTLAILTARLVQVRFDKSGRKYTYFTDDETIKTGDMVVVAAPYSDADICRVPGTGSDSVQRYAKTAEVVSTEETVEGIEKVREWIVGKVDIQAYVDRVEREKARALLVAKINRAKAEALAEIDLRDLAGRSPELKGLLDQLQNFGDKPKETSLFGKAPTADEAATRSE